MVSKNEKRALKRKQKKKELLEKIEMDKLYEESKLDPQTVEGQFKLKIGIFTETKQIKRESWVGKFMKLLS